MKRLVGPAMIAALVLAAGVPHADAQHEGHQEQRPSKPEQTPAPKGAVDHSQHQKPSADLPAFIPPITEEDRRAAFPDVEGPYRRCGW